MIGNHKEYEVMSRVESDFWWYKNLQHLVIQNITKYFPDENPFILDAGCGTGGMMKFLRQCGYQHTEGFDISDDALEFCRQHHLKCQKSRIQDIKQHYESASKDLILSNDTLYFLNVEERKQALRDFHHILKPGGILLLNLPALAAFKGIHDLSVGINQRFRRQDVKEMLHHQAFDLLSATYWPFLLSPIIFTVRGLQRIKLRFSSTPIVSDLNLPSKAVNHILYRITRFENNLLKRKPFGSSLFLVLQSKSL